ncbi:GntR family transcriptional regulator [Thermoplasmatales archaeon AK]|nr:GntR family transcriptional regulator [Thermoplasmatales archaeon AK]
MTRTQAKTTANTDYVYESLRSRILRGYYAVREKLKEEAIAKEFNTSRSRVRLAFLRLVDDGLLESEPHKGVIIKEISLREAVEILEIRKLLEIHAVKEACRNITSDQLSSLESILHSMKQAIDSKDYEMYSRLNTNFHEIIYQSAAQATLTNVLISLKTRLMRYQYKLAFIPGRAQRSFQEHREIFQALADRDEARAEVCVTKHIDHLREHIVQNRQLLEISGGF